MTNAMSEEEEVYWTGKSESSGQVQRRGSGLSMGGVESTQQRKSHFLPRWVCDWRTWASVVATLGMIGLGVWWLLENESDKQRQFREEVEGIGQWYATALGGQVRTSVSSLHALEALLKVDAASLVSDNFQVVAETLRESLEGITNLQLAPFGTLRQIHPLVSPEHGLDNSGALGHALLLDPGRKGGSLAAIHSGAIVMVGPLQLLQGGVAVIARLAIFSKFAPEYLPSEEWTKNGETYSRDCSDPAQREAECHYPGPAEEDGSQTYFWGFATMLTLVTDLLKPLELDKLEGTYHLHRSFEYQLSDSKPHKSMADSAGIFAHSKNAGPGTTLSDPVLVEVNVEEAGVAWRLAIVPSEGWPTVTSDFWIQVVLLTLACGMMGTAAVVLVLTNVRGAYRRLQRLEEFRWQKKLQAVEQSVADLSRVRFPMCIMKMLDFERLGELIPHEQARERSLLKFLDTINTMQEYSKSIVFFSHQWSGYSHPDHDGTQYKSAIQSYTALNEKPDMTITHLWFDFFSIPQENQDCQQNAIETLAIYATYCRVFVAIVPHCMHEDRGTPVNEESYSRRAWCRLEQFAFLCSRDRGCLPAFKCDSQGELKPFWAGAEEDCNLWHQSLDVMSGDLTCCTRGHPDGQPCDKTKITGVMLGLLWRLKSTAEKNDGSSKRAKALLKAINSNSERYFPRNFTYVSQSDFDIIKEKKELFGSLVEVLERMFEQSEHYAVPQVWESEKSGEEGPEELQEAEPDPSPPDEETVHVV